MQINYNVTGNERKALVKVISDTIGEKAKYLGMPSAAFRIGGFTVSKTGVLEYDDGTDATGILDAIRKAGFTDGEAEAVEQQGEGTTEPETDGLHIGTSEEETSEVDGLTIGMPRSFFTGESLDNLKKLIDSKASLIKAALGVGELPIVIDDEKVEFPWFSEPDADTAEAAAIFISKLCEMAKNATRVTAQDHEVENPKYAMRCFLLRLGFIGAEYKSARKMLLKNLSGNSSWKNGRKEDVQDEAAE